MATEEKPFDLTIFRTEMKTTREMMGVTQQKLADDIGMTPNYIYAIETGRKTPSLKIAFAIAKRLNLSMDAMLSIDRDREGDSKFYELVSRIAKMEPGQMENVELILNFLEEQDKQKTKE